MIPKFGMFTDAQTPHIRNTISAGAFSSEVHEEQGGHLFVVAEGIGPGKRGELASRIAVEQAALQYYTQMQIRPTMLATLALEQTLRETSRKVFQEAYDLYAEGVMGTSIVVALIRKSKLTLAWIGNVRAYLIHYNDTRAFQLTKDFAFDVPQDKPWSHRVPGVLGIAPENPD